MILSSAVLKNIIREALETAESDENSFDISIVIDMLEYIIDRYYEADCSFILANQDHRFVITAAQILDSVDFNELGIMIADNERIDPYANDSFIVVLLWEKFKVQNKINDITNIDFVSLRNVISEIFDEFLKQAEDDEDADMLNVTIEEDDGATHLLQKILQLCHANEKINELCSRTHSRELRGFIATSIDPGNNELMIPRISAMIIRFIKQNKILNPSVQSLVELRQFH